MSSDNVMLQITQIPTVCLSMIVKNESAIICRFLDTVKDIIDYACICDTGSTDDTVAIIEKYMEDNNLKGHVIKKEFVDFSTNRNYALDEARKYGDYILLLDADMKLMNCDQFDKTKLDGRGYCLKQCGSSLVYYNLRLIPSNVKSCYIGVTHEYLSFDGVTVNHESLYIDDKGDGGCKADKFTRDERLLRKGLEDDPSNARYAFYLANTLRDLGKNEEAIEFYKKRISLGGWDEELFYSQYQIGVCYERLGEETLMEKAYLDAWEMRPTRAEPLYDLAKYFRLKRKNIRSWGYAIIGKDIEQSDDKLFVHSDKYNTAFDREITITSYYTPPAQKTMKLFRRIFNEDTCDLDLSNFAFYRKAFMPDRIIDFSCDYTFDCIGEETHYNSSTPCIIANNDGYDMIIRMVNYSITGNGDYVHDENKNVISSVYAHLRLSSDLSRKDDIDRFYKPDIQGLPTHWGGKMLHGIEDMKLFNRNGYLHTIGNTCTPNGKISIVTGHLTHDSVHTNLEMLDYECEKNWCVIPSSTDPSTDSMCLVYKWHPLTLIEADLTTGKVSKTRETSMPSLFRYVRGSTDGCIFNDRIYFLGHIVQHTKPRTYSHICVEFDLDMNYIGCSYPFKLSTSSVEYCLGMIVENDRIIFSYSENDASSKIAVINRERFFKEHWMD